MKRNSPPRAAGLFRPWWHTGPVNTIRLSAAGDQVEVESLFVNMPHGRPVHVEKESSESTARCVHFLDAGGMLRTAPSYKNVLESPGAIVLARRNGSGFRIKAPISTLDADDALVSLDLEIRVCADDWRVRLEQSPDLGEHALAATFAAVGRGGDAARKLLKKPPKGGAAERISLSCQLNRGEDIAIRLASLGDAARALSVRLAGTNEGIKGLLRSAPKDLAHHRIVGFFGGLDRSIHGRDARGAIFRAARLH